MIRNIFLFVLGLAFMLGAVYCFLNWKGVYFPKSENPIFVNGMFILFFVGALMFHMMKKRE